MLHKEISWYTFAFLPFLFYVQHKWKSEVTLENDCESDYILLSFFFFFNYRNDSCDGFILYSMKITFVQDWAWR